MIGTSVASDSGTVKYTCISPKDMANIIVDLIKHFNTTNNTIIIKRTPAAHVQ